MSVDSSIKATAMNGVAYQKLPTVILVRGELKGIEAHLALNVKWKGDLKTNVHTE